MHADNHALQRRRAFWTGNRCERGAGKENKTKDLPNLYAYKLKRLFGYQPLAESAAPRGHVALPRVLNLYEDYPFWFTFFTKLGYRVVLSPMSTKELFTRRGMDTISSDTACYPAKLVHGHIKTLVEMGEKWIFILYQLWQLETKDAQNHYNCPIVATYPEVIANNMNEIFTEYGVEFTHPFVPYDKDERLIPRLYEILKHKGIEKREIKGGGPRGARRAAGI